MPSIKLLKLGKKQMGKMKMSQARICDLTMRRARNIDLPTHDHAHEYERTIGPRGQLNENRTTTHGIYDHLMMVVLLLEQEGERMQISIDGNTISDTSNFSIYNKKLISI